MNAKELKIINETQDEYENILVSKLLNKEVFLKTINFTSPTGTGKTKMMADLINKLPNDYYFVITTLSRGQLNKQIKSEVKRFCKKDNYVVYGLSDYTENTILQKEDILKLIPKDKKLIWFRDEGHIHTNRWFEILEEISFRTVNFSATNTFNSQDDVNCNFAHTMMLRTLKQQTGTPEDALNCLVKVKSLHKKIKNYNPCAIFRILDNRLLNRIISGCKRRKLKYINITTDDYDMSDLCQDNNEYDVIINKFKIVEGIDIRRAHVLYMTNEPSNPNTTIQLIGRCRRNALLYRDDIDIMDPKNSKLLQDTRICYAFYNINDMDIDEDENGNLVAAFCSTISVQDLKSDVEIKLNKGTLQNGLKVFEANEQSGTFKVIKDKTTGFNVLSPETSFYKNETFNFVHYYSTMCNKTGKIKNFEIKDMINNWTLFNDCCYAKTLKKGKVMFCADVVGLQGIFNKLIRCENDHVFIYIRKLPRGKYRITQNLSSYISLSDNGIIKILLKQKIGVYSKRLNFDYDHAGEAKEEEVNPTYYHNELINFYKKKLKDVDDVIKFDMKLKDVINLLFIEIDIQMYEGGSTKKQIYKHSAKGVDDTFKAYSLSEILEKIKAKKMGHWYFRDKGRNMVHKYILETKDLEYVAPDDNNFTYGRVLPYYYESYDKTINNRELAIVGAENFKIVKHDHNYDFIEDNTVTSKIAKNSKLNRFISQRYAAILKNAKPHLFKVKNNFDFTKQLNSALGYCVEYYSKDVVFSRKYSEPYNERDRAKAVRDSLEMYRSMMSYAYKIPTSTIKCPSFNMLLREQHKPFVNTVIKLGTKTANFVKDYMKINKYQTVRYDPNLSTNHLTALADYVFKDTIIDIKVTGTISEHHVRQVLAYHYLSTMRSDLKINKVLVYEAVTGRCLEINIKTSQVKLIN